MSEHTPGPWFVYLPKGVSGGCREIRTEKGRTHGTYRGTAIASTHGLSDDYQDEANALVMAAAPRLLEALKRLCDEHRYSELEEWVEARAAIAKAKGQCADPGPHKGE